MKHHQQADEPPRSNTRLEAAGIREQLGLDEQSGLQAFMREHPHLQHAAPEWQLFYYRIQRAVRQYGQEDTD